MQFPVAVNHTKAPTNNATLYLEDPGFGQGSDSNVHAAQFPSISWLTGTKPDEALGEPTEWYIETSGSPRTWQWHCGTSES
jgi:hypothetical protein